MLDFALFPTLADSVMCLKSLAGCFLPSLVLLLLPLAMHLEALKHTELVNLDHLVRYELDLYQ